MVDGTAYVKLADSVALWPPLEIDTSTAPAECGPVTAVIELLELTTTFDAGLPPSCTVEVEPKLVPIILIGVPPRVLPAVGVMLDTRGGPSDD